jgi:gliding motility-associated-like protein
VVIDTFAGPVCAGENSGFASASASGGTDPIAFLWDNNPPSGSATMTGAAAGFYNVTATDGNGCTAMASVMLEEPPPLAVSIFPSDTTITYGDSVTLRAVHWPADITPSYVWQPSNLALWCVAPCAEPTIVPAESVAVTVHISVQGASCSASAEAVVKVEHDNTMHAPNVFSPNGDGENDEFEIFYSPSLTGITYMIFNRWGEKLFETHTPGEFWDGTYRGELLNPGVYVYWVEGDFIDGTQKTLKGSFTLLR